MKQTVSLPLDPQPIPRTDFELSFPYAILKGRLGDLAQRQFCHKYISCAFQSSQEKNMFDYCLDDCWFQHSDYLSYQRLYWKKETPAILQVDLIRWLRKILSLDMYPSGICNERTLLNNPAVEETAEFAYLLTGYDHRAKHFTLAGISSDLQYLQLEIPYDAFLQALSNTNATHYEIRFWKWKSGKDAFSLPELRFQLQNYLSGAIPDYSNQTSTYYGISAVTAMAKAFSEGRPMLPLEQKRCLRSFYEHKQLFLQTITYLCQENFFPECFLSSYLPIQETAKEICCAMPSFTPQQHGQSIRLTAQLEQEVLKQILRYLQDHTDSDR